MYSYQKVMEDRNPAIPHRIYGKRQKKIHAANQVILNQDLNCNKYKTIHLVNKIENIIVCILLV